MASKEKVDIRRSEQFQEMDDALTRAMAELDSTIDRVSALFQPDGPDAPPEAGEAPPETETAATTDAAEKPGEPPNEDAEGGEGGDQV
ncbi:MAG: hypothetical protein KF886_12845 [Candidatus Hydrogenedentes bacterium]|nr:hypothetical protein [Candidatus Hydrogenedentota bacterium]